MEEEFVSKILKIGFVANDVKSFVIEKPEGYVFNSGQATNLSINTLRFRDEKRPFTFTSTNNDLVIEFIVKKYNGLTKNLHELNPGDEVIIREPFGSINYFGPGIFIAGGTGITPFLSIFRSLGEEIVKSNKLFFFNKTHKDIICEGELREMFNENVIFSLTDEKRKGYLNKKINKSFLKKEITDFSGYFYICGSPGFVESIRKSLIELGADKNKIIF
ncbi:flavodoxin reductase [Candidatus Pacearchaeota archaeon]|jgi:predicted ferric reductase|nr:flavodoxin reductase [Candidatus Pacearchaeota archaeon]